MPASDAPARCDNPECARVAALVESSWDAIISVDLDGTLTSFNPAAERLYSYSADEVLGQSFALLIPPERCDELQHLIGSVRRGERVASFETQRLRKDGTRVDVSTTFSPIRDREGTLIGASGIARDITDLKRAEAERETLYRELLERDERLHALMQDLLLRADESRRRAAAPILSRLTSREQEVIVLVADGKSNPEIGAALGCSTLTARNHVQNILSKLNLADRTQLAVWAVRHGLVPLHV